jgi:hypothetical protein
VATRDAFEALRADIDELRERLAEVEERAQLFPHRTKYLLLVTAFLRRYLDLHRELVEELERVT